MKSMYDNTVKIRLLNKLRTNKRGCWLWLKSRDPNGYGHIVINKKLKQSHRVSYELHKGPIPPGMLVCHTCDVRRCINPDHLFLGTHKDNTRDAFNKNRMKPNCVKLTCKQAEKIRSLYETGKWTHRSLGAHFGVSKSTIWDILKYNHWIPKVEMPNFKNKFSRRKLDLKKVEEIRSKYATGSFSQNNLAQEYQVSQTCIWEIVTFRTWQTHP